MADKEPDLINVSPAVHGDNCRRYFARDARTLEAIPDDAIGNLAAALDGARRSAEGIVELQRTLVNDPTRTPAARSVELRRASLAAGERAAKAIDAARSQAETIAKTIGAATAAPPAPATALAAGLEAETRAAFRGLDAKTRRVAVNAAIEAGDAATIGPLLRGPAMLAGMTQPEQDDLRGRWRLKQHPVEADRIERLEKAIEAADMGAMALVRFTERFAAPAEKAALAEQRSRAALEAAE